MYSKGRCDGTVQNHATGNCYIRIVPSNTLIVNVISYQIIRGLLNYSASRFEYP